MSDLPPQLIPANPVHDPVHGRVWLTALERSSSDEVRKRLIGLARDAVAPAAAYEDWASKEVYERLGHEAGREVAANRSVVIDATFRRPVDAQAFVRSFQGAGALTQAVVVHCTASPETLRRRVEERALRGGSDAGIEILAAQLDATRDLPLGISNAIELSTEGTLTETLAAGESIVLDATLE